MINRILYIVALVHLYLIALLPFWAIYLISDCLYFLLRHVVRYRRKVIVKNLSESFPEKSPEEIKRLANEFYRNFADYIMETIKLLHISDRQIKKRMVFENVGMIDDLFDQGKSIAAYFSHCFNWEWAPSVTLWSRYKANVDAAFCQVYRPLRSQWVDKLMLRVRSRFNPISIPKARTLRELLTLRKEGMPSITGFMADQKPSHGDPTYVMRFLNHPTAMITGTETLARRLDMAAIYWDMEKVKRGRYKITCRLIGIDLKPFSPMAITHIYGDLLQQTIRRNPALWLWSHKRWKIPVQMPEENVQS